MKVNLYSIYDQVAQTYTAPFVGVNDNDVKRQFIQLCKNPDTPYAKFVGDYSVYCVGTWDDSEGTLDNVIPPKFIIKNISPEDEELEKVLKDIGGAK